MEVRAVRFFGPGDVRLDRIEVPSPGPGEIRILPAAVGICGTDVHIAAGEFPATPGVVLGHEVAGTVESVGPDIDWLKEGDLVCIEPHVYCRQCRYCRLGMEHLCRRKAAYGVHLHGGMAEALVVEARTAFRLPDFFDPTVGCLAEPVGCCVHGLDRLAPVSGTSLLVIGAGPAGLILTKLATLTGAVPIAVSEPRRDRRDLAMSMGAALVVDPSSQRWRDELLVLTDGVGFDSVIDASGSAAGLEAAVDLAAPGASILVFGVAKPDDVARIRPYALFQRELSILGTVINPYTHERAVRMLPGLGLEAFSIEAFPLDAFKDAFEAHRRGDATKVVIAPRSALL